MSAFLNIFGFLLTGFLLITSPVHSSLADNQEDCDSNKQIMSCCNDGQCHMMWTKHNAPDSPKKSHQCCCKHSLNFITKAVLNLPAKTSIATYTGSGNGNYQNLENFSLHSNQIFWNTNYYKNKSKITHKTEQSFLCVFRI